MKLWRTLVKVYLTNYLKYYIMAIVLMIGICIGKEFGPIRIIRDDGTVCAWVK